MPFFGEIAVVGSLIAGMQVYFGEPVTSMTVVETHFQAAQRKLNFEFHPRFEWAESVVSWNSGASFSLPIQIVLTPIGLTVPTGSYTLANWELSSDPDRHFSGKAQKDSYGDLQTDTLVMNAPQRSLSISFELSPPIESSSVAIRLIAANFLRTKVVEPADLSDHKVWGKTPLGVPQRSQMSYENGDVLCSPTSVSMLLAYWAKKLNRPEIDHDVPEVAAGVFDKNWPGTGNWPFNTAYIGAIPGMRAFVDRMQGVSELEKWIEAGVPAACSVSYDLLRGKGRKGTNDGHLVVLVGFTKDGNPIVNDPGRSTETRQIYLRKDFRDAWRTSKQTVYLAFPRGWHIPKLARLVFN